jgi:hypothetical protein
MEDTSVFISVFIPYSAFIAYSTRVYPVVRYQHLRSEFQRCWERKRDLRNSNSDVRFGF